MSAPPHRHGATTPLHQRTQSQNNTLGIRIVPYTPPKIDPEGRVPSQASSRTQTTAPGRGSGSGDYDNHTIRRPSWTGDEKEEYASSTSPGSALSSPSVSSLLLAKAKDEGVSVSKLYGYPSAPGSRGPTAPGLRSPSEVSINITPVNASPLQDTTGSIRTGEPPSPVSPASAASHRRPLSRRRNFVAVHSDKTFSLVRPGQQPQSELPSPILSPGVSVSYSSRTTSSHERPSIDAWSDGGRTSSPTGTTATIPDSSLTEIARVSPSPGPPPKHLVEDPTAGSPWNYRMVGGLRKVPKTPDLKSSKGPASSTASSPETLAPLPEITVYRDEDDQDSRTVVPKPSFASVDSAQTFSTTSETTNYKVYGASSSPQPSIDSLPLLPRQSSSNPNYEVIGESSSAPNSNYEILGKSSPPPSNPNYEIIGESSPVSNPNYEILGESSPVSNPNYEILGRSSPASNPNYEIICESSPVSNPNYEILGKSSPAPFSSSPPETSSGNENYVLHGDPSPSSSLATVPRQPRPTYSQESLVVPPLRPAKKKSYEKLGYYKQRSRENLRARAGSLQSLKSISSIITNQDPTQAFLATPVLINFGASASRDARAGFSGSTSQQFPWSAPQAPGSSTTGSSVARSTITQRPVQMIQEHPHQWSSQLSTVMSESEAGTDRSPSRSASPSTAGNGHHRRSSAGWGGSMHSRQLQSISSSLAGQLEEATPGSKTPDRPQPTYARAGTSQMHMVRDQDEHGDGLTDLHERPSRTSLSAFFMSSNSSSRNLHSSASSRSNSLNSSSIPAWARVYYGSGERKFLGAPSIAESDVGERPGSTGFYSASESPNGDHYLMALHSQRKRPREVHPHANQRPFSDSASMDIAPAPMGDYSVFRSIKRKTSSIWSPHLRQDRRASRYSVWDPPSVSWSADSGILGKRNAQVVLFILGFIFPFAWMIGAILPLPPNPKFEMLERGDNSDSRPRRPRPDFTSPPRVVDETRFESARWWRNLNRIMSIVGLLIIGAIVALAVIGVREHWIVDTS